ncbi:hypothetical protein BHE74_00045118 [Ensete ventricosum]|nr:hypothetical protein GW17_00006631 [Ensete ventricosum]RWW48775.1 hypothetical protein BHE74_00045118 [Ensete ventricosum]RZR76443.1 hypothetical protein BHM03_00001225 [Ensete ventricosum]
MGQSGQDREHRNGVGPQHPPPPPQSFPAWARSTAECQAEFAVSTVAGLRSEEVAWRREIYGWNELEKHSGPSIWRLVLGQFEDTLVRILLAAAVVSFLLAWYDGDRGGGGEAGLTAFVEPLVIFLILVVNAVVGVWQENNAEKALEALKEIQSEHAAVRRDGKLIPSLPAKELVPGDIVELRVGDKVPADMRVLQLISSTFRVDQGSLTGESAAVNKTNRVVNSEDTDIQGKECMVFAGTTVVNGSCVCLVTQIGMNTEIGKIHLQIHEACQSDDETPLKKKLNEFGEVLTAIIGVICAFVWLINVKYFLTWEYVDGWPRNFRFSFEKCTYYFEIAVALAVAAIPEGLPAVITTSLALGTRKMAQKNALVRRLPSVETLGCTTVICSDKTGTLTTNQMSAVRIVAMGRQTNDIRKFKVVGATYDPCDGEIHDWPAENMDDNLQMIAKIAAVCNDASISNSGHQYVASGMPTEAALKVLVEKMGIPGDLDPSSLESSEILQPKHKQEIVRLLKEDGEVVAMTGDGVNDAPALKLADIGIAMGISGTEVIGLYVGIATVGVFIIWYTHGSFLGIDLSGDGHTLLTYSQLANWAQCSAWEGFSAAPFTAGSHIFSFDTNPCEYFQSGKVKATTLSLSVLVAIEMFNSLNALSENGSLLTVHPWANPWLLLAMCVSFGLHFVIIYVPFLARVFGIVPLSFNEWLLVLVVAFPVILIDELLKFVGRCRSSFDIQRLSKRYKVD